MLSRWKIQALEEQYFFSDTFVHFDGREDNFQSRRDREKSCYSTLQYNDFIVNKLRLQVNDAGAAVWLQQVGARSTSSCICD
jgi:hypothetical protein